MSDHEDLDYEEVGDDRDEPRESNEAVSSIRHARVEFPSDDEEERERVNRMERERRPMKEWKKMPWKTEREEREERRKADNDIKLTPEMRYSLYRELRVDDTETVTRVDTVIVKGADGMRSGQLEKIFGDYYPYKTEMLDVATGLIYFRSNADAAKMMIGMTKRLRRVRVKKVREDGEVRDSSDEEEGELKMEGGDDVAVEDQEVGPRVVKMDSVEINVDEVALPEGKWRVVIKHVPNKKLLLARFATHSEIMACRKYQMESGEGRNRKRRSNESSDGFKYTWMEEKNRAGLNIFDREGNELDWDFEHDTRFFEDSAETAEEEKKDEEVMAAWPVGVKVRGRGARHARFGIKDTSMNADEESGSKKRREDIKDEIPISRRMASRVTGGVFADEDEEDLRRSDDDEDTDPTPQQWNKHKNGLEGRVTYHR